MIARLRHWWRRLCGEYVRGGGGDVMKLQWDW